MSLKILIDRRDGRIATHAKKMQKKMEEYEDRAHWTPHDHVNPLGVPSHLAIFPVRCDDCGETYWANSPWAEHQRCRGVRSKAGFG